MKTDRRTFCGWLGAGAIAGGAARLLPIGPAAGTRHIAGTATLGDLSALAEWVRTTPRAELVGKALELHRAGTDWRDLLGAAFLAGIRDVEPRPVGFRFHCVLMTSSAFQVAAGLPAAERVLTALYNLDDLKLSQERGGDWKLPPPPAAVADDGARAATEFAAAIDAFDEQAADRAATALARNSSLDETFQLLWTRGARDFTNIGHKPIFIVQAYRTLQQIGWRHGEEVLRSLAWGLCSNGPGEDTAAFAANQELARKHAAAFVAGSTADRGAYDLCKALRKADVDGAAAAEAVVAAAKGGLPVGSIHDGLRLWSVELLTRLPGIVGVHPLTATNALLYSARHCAEVVDQVLLTLQAARWLAHYCAFFARQGQYDEHREGLEAMAPAADKASVADAFAAAADRGWQAAVPTALAAIEAHGQAAFAAGARHWLVRKVHEHHDYKFTAALIEEAARASPAIGNRMLAAGICWLRGPGGTDHPVAKAGGA